MNLRVCPSPGESHAPDRVRVALADDARAAGQARRAVKDALLSWRLPGLVDSVVLSVSELVTNALRHGTPPVHLVLRREPACVHVDVHDARPVPPPDAPPHADEHAESGRGLEIVHALATDVGCRSVPGDGKVVHAAFPTGLEQQGA